MKLAYVDSSIWIICLEGISSYKSKVNAFIEAEIEPEYEICISDAVLLEVLVKPYRTNDRGLINAYRAVLGLAKHLSIHSGIFEDALKILQTEHLHAMDAIHLSIAKHHRCDCIVTADSNFKSVSAVAPKFFDLRS
ncbi:MAG: PIN domain-containing protein [Planctomycetes bacterium]|nr:PIN domain-containing protein [Planctomycetota bacterium]